MAEVTVKSGFSAVRVYINGVVHLHLPRASFRGFQSWLFSRADEYSIEISLEGAAPMLLEYADADLWKAVLKALDEAFS